MLAPAGERERSAHKGEGSMRNLARVLPLVVVLAFCLPPPQPGIAQPPTSKGEKAAFEQELAELRRNRPAEFEQAKRLFTFGAQQLLARLGYGVGPFDGVLDEKTAAALRAYEKVRGVPVTGDPMSFETMERVRQDGVTLDQQPPYLPRRHVFTDLWDSGYVSASGTWTISGEEMAWPEQSSRIHCHRETGRCTEATAMLMAQDGQKSLHLDIDTYEIERWDKHEIVTKPLQFGCTRYVRRITRLQKAASGIRSTTSADASCKGLDQSEKYLVLADGFDVYWRLQKAHWKKSGELMRVAPELAKYLEGAKQQKK